MLTFIEVPTYNSIVINGDYIMYNLNKADLGSFLQGLMADAGIKCSKERATAMISELFNYLSSSVANGYRVSIHQFGVFEPRFRKASFRNNPQDPTGTVRIPVKERYVPVFRPYTYFKEAVNTYDGEPPYGATEEQKCPTGECTVE